jgi:outer membrane protein assembly factor BamB
VLVAGVVAATAAPQASAQLPQLPPLPGIPPSGGQPQPPGPPQGQPPAEGAKGAFGDVVSYRMNPQHTGATAEVRVFGPLFRLWSHSFHGPASTPLIVPGRVIVNVARSDGVTGGPGSRVVALDPRTGRRVWSREAPAVQYAAHIAVAGGRVVSVNEEGVARAFAVKDGRPLWTFRPNGTYFARTVPVAAGGSVYFAVSTGSSGEAALYALSMRTGKPRWRRPVPVAPDGAMPLLDSRRVILTDPCGNAVALRRSDGATAWSRQPESDCLGAAAGLMLGGRVFTPSKHGYVYDPATGADRKRLPGGAPDAAAGGLGFRVVRDALNAVSLANGKRRWHHGGSHGYEDVLRPVVAGRTTFTTTSDGHLLGLDRNTGAFLSKTTFPYGAHSSVGGIEPGMSVGHGLLVGSADRRVNAFAPVLVPRAKGTDVALSSYDIKAGKQVIVVGGLGRKIKPRGRRKVALERDGYPFGNRRKRERGRTLADGAVYYGYRPLRNTRYRLLLRGKKTPARAVTVYAYPFQKHRIRSVGQHDIELRLSMKADRGFHGGGHDLIVYWWRHGSKRIFRVGSGGIAQTGTGRAHVVVVFRRPSHTSRRDRIFWCIRGLHGYGRYDPHCGDSRERY